MENTKTKPTTITPKFALGQIVFLITDPEQRERMVTAYFVTKRDVIYYLSCGDSETRHYDIEIATDKDWNKV